MIRKSAECKSVKCFIQCGGGFACWAMQIYTLQYDAMQYNTDRQVTRHPLMKYRPAGD